MQPKICTPGPYPDQIDEDAIYYGYPDGWKILEDLSTEEVYAVPDTVGVILIETGNRLKVLQVKDAISKLVAHINEWEMMSEVLMTSGLDSIDTEVEGVTYQALKTIHDKLLCAAGEWDLC